MSKPKRIPELFKAAEVEQAELLRCAWPGCRGTDVRELVDASAEPPKKYLLCKSHRDKIFNFRQPNSL